MRQNSFRRLKKRKKKKKRKSSQWGWASFSDSSKISMLGIIISIVGIAFSLISFTFSKPASHDVDTKIRELDDIQQALSSLSSYIEIQQKQLKAVSSQKVILEQERDELQRILQIDRDKLDSLLEYQTAQANQSTRYQVIISFFIGVLSSSVVTIGAITIQTRRKEKQKREPGQENVQLSSGSALTNNISS